MPIQISCPTCQRQLRVPDNLVGQMVKCPSCQNTFTASVEEGPAPPKNEDIFAGEDLPSRERKPAREERIRDDEPPVKRRRTAEDDDFEREDRPSRRRKDFVPHRGTLILVLGILSLTGAGMFTGIPAWIMGNNDMAQIRAGVMDPDGESNTNIGRILGMVSTIIGIVALVGGCFCCGLGMLPGIMK